jgi:hypothetical protein
MLSDLIETTHIESFRLALFHLEGFDIQGCEWSIDQKNRVQLGSWRIGISKGYCLIRTSGLLLCPLPVVYTVKGEEYLRAYIA